MVLPMRFPHQATGIVHPLVHEPLAGQKHIGVAGANGQVSHQGPVARLTLRCDLGPSQGVGAEPVDSQVLVMLY